MFDTPTDLIQHYQPQLATQWEHYLSQKNNRLEGCVTMRQLSGKVTFIDKIQDTHFQEKTGRMSKTELNEMEYGKRAIHSTEYDQAIGFDEFDEIKLHGQRLPITETLQKLAEDYQRVSEKLIIDSALGTAYEGEKGVNPIELPDSQTIPLDFAYGTNVQNSGLTYAKFARLRRLAMENEAFGQGIMNGADCLCLVTTASGIEDLYHDIFVNNREYLTSVDRVRQGEVDMFLGVKIIRTEQLPSRLVGGQVVRDNVAFVKSKVTFGMRNNYSTKMSIRDDLSEAIQLRAKFAIGASRTEEEGVWKMPCTVTS
ncbi:phage capsid protein [Akkermansiaceae bacterium]|nr:phage capsid protein [Akkermansiaceae bacterium]